MNTGQNDNPTEQRPPALCASLGRVHTEAGGLFLPKTVARFWSHVDRRGQDECWTWTGCRQTGGYGQMRIKGKKFLAHRMAYSLIVGPIPANTYACHRCDNPRCVNPSHIFLGTQADNIHDAVKKGRILKGEQQTGSKLKDFDVKLIRHMRTVNNVTIKTIARYFGVSEATVSGIVNGRRWRHVEAQQKLITEARP